MTELANSILNALERGETPDYDLLSTTADISHVFEQLLTTTAGRRWLRLWPAIPTHLASRLVAIEDDFQTTRRDRSLDAVVAQAPVEDVLQQAAMLAASPAAGAFWNRLSNDPALLAETAVSVIRRDVGRASENTLFLLVMDPMDPYDIGEERRIAIALAALESQPGGARSLAAEYLFDHNPDALADRWRELVTDDDERMRALGWSAGLRSDTGVVFNEAIWLLGDASIPVPVRRSALAALGTNFETRDVVDVLAEYVVHDDHDLALDAGNLLYRLHRHPTIATAAAKSPHADVRDIGEFLLDPYRGSPAAGGSRPGDPTHSDIFAEMIRNTEERMLADDEESTNKP